MNPENRKEYNKNYYEINKTTILGKACAKIECEFCHRKVAQVNLLKHYTLPICRRKAELLKTLEARKHIN